jgi:hypothetical protein
MWMVFPLVGLAINLVWPRKRSLKAVGIVLLLLTAYIHGFSGLNPLDRVVGLAERIATGQQPGTPEQVVSNLRIGQALAHQTMFDVSLGLTLAVLFAATPDDVIACIRSRFHTTPKADNQSENA